MVVSDKSQTRFLNCACFIQKCRPIKNPVRVWRIQTNCREQSLVRPTTDQNIYYVGRIKTATAVAGEEVAVSEDVNVGAAWTLEKEDLLAQVPERKLP